MMPATRRWSKRSIWSGSLTTQGITRSPSFEVLAQLVGSEEKLRLEPKVGSVPVRLLRLGRLGGGSVAGGILGASPRHDPSQSVISSCAVENVRNLHRRPFAPACRLNT